MKIRHRKSENGEKRQATGVRQGQHAGKMNVGTRPNRENGKAKHQQELLDEAIEESFPASDSPSPSRVD